MQYDKFQIKKNDKVKVIAGKDKGKVGKVLFVDKKKQRLKVESINLMKHHQRPNAQLREGGIVEKEVPIHRSNVMLMCNKCVSPTRIRTKSLKDGRKSRMCAKCNELIDT